MTYTTDMPLGMKIDKTGEIPVRAWLGPGGLQLWNQGHDDHPVILGPDSLDQLVTNLTHIRDNH